MSNIITIRVHLDSPLYDEVKINARKSFVAWIGERLASWSKQVLAYVPDPKDPWQRKFPFAGFPGQFFTQPRQVVEAKKSRPSVGPRENYVVNEIVAAAVKAGDYAVDVAKAEKEADARWEADKAFYANRVGLKLDEMLQADAQIDCNLERNGYLTGTVTAVVDSEAFVIPADTLEAGKTFRIQARGTTASRKTLVLRTSLKINYRYGENAANGDITIYRQVPTVVQSASGFDPVAREREIAQEAASAKNDRKAKCGACAKELQILTRRKGRWEDVYSTLRYSANHSTGLPINGNLDSIQKTLAELGLPTSSLPSLNDAKLQVADLRAQVKAAKLALKAARAVKA